jgi:hypothetical protein
MPYTLLVVDAKRHSHEMKAYECICQAIRFSALGRQHPENCVNEVRQKDRTFYIRVNYLGASPRGIA